MIGTLVLALALQSAIHAGSGGSQALSVPPASGCTSGSCTFTWTGTSGEAISTYDPGFVALSPSHPLSAITLDGAGHVQIGSFVVSGFRYTGSTSDTAQIVFAASPGGDSNIVKGLSVRSDGTGDGYAMEPCFNDGTGKWNKICIKKNGTEIAESPGSSYDPTVDNTAKIVVSGATTVTISVYWNGTLLTTATDSTSPIPPGGNPGAYSGNGSASAAQQQFGTFQDH